MGESCGRESGRWQTVREAVNGQVVGRKSKGTGCKGAGVMKMLEGQVEVAFPLLPIPTLLLLLVPAIP